MVELDEIYDFVLINGRMINLLFSSWGIGEEIKLIYIE